MPDCDNPKCHEQMTTELNKRATWEQYDALKADCATKMPKTWLRWWWMGFAAIGIPLISTSIGVWSGQQSDILRYADKALVIDNQIRLTRLEEFRQNTRRDLDCIKVNVDEILKIMRGKDHEKKN